MSNPKVSAFNLKAFTKQRTLYNILLKNVISNENAVFKLIQEPTFYSKTYWKINQNYPLNTKVDVPLAELNHYRKREYLAKYLVYQMDHKSKEIFADINELTLNCFFKTNYLRFPDNLNIQYKNEDFLIEIKVLTHHRNKVNRICGERVRKELKKEILQYLDAALKTDRLKANKALIFEDVLNKSFTKNLLHTITKNGDFIKGVVVTRIFLKPTGRT